MQERQTTGQEDAMEEAVEGGDLPDHGQCLSGASSEEEAGASTQRPESTDGSKEGLRAKQARASLVWGPRPISRPHLLPCGEGLEVLSK